MPKGVFRTWQRDDKPLSVHLRQHFLRPLLQRVEQMSLAKLETDLDELARRLVDEVRVQPPVLVGQEEAGYGPGLQRPAGERGVSLATTRYYTAVQVEGDIMLLEEWPDEVERASELQPVDEGLGDWVSLPSAGELDQAEVLRRYTSLLAQDRWSVRERTDGGPWALFTFVDLTEDEQQQVELGHRQPAKEVSAALAQVQPIVDAIGEQTRRFFDHDLPAQLAEHLRRRRRWLRAHQAVLDSLVFPAGWKNSEPTLEPVPDTAQTAPEAALQDVHLGKPARLAPASFTDVLRTLRVWADAVERHPRAYRSLVEDHVSDLIAATLNAALPGAHREVFNRGGKPDIYVRADTLSEGAAPARIFIFECKRWHGEKKAMEALEQLFGYLDARDTSAVLLFLVPLVDFGKARTDALAMLQTHVDFVAPPEPEPVEGWTVLRYDRPGGTARVCIVFINLPDLAD